MARESEAKTSAVLSWRAPEYFYYPKSNNWFASVLIAAVVIAILFLLLRSFDWTFAAVLVLGVFVLLQKADHKPETMAVSINQNGISIGDRAYPFENLRAWHITDHGDYLSIDFPPKKFGFPVSVLTADENVENIRETLSKYLPEEPLAKEYLNDRITRWFRF